MKLLTFVIPSYNSQDYLNRCVDSLIAADWLLNEIEILIINDGSTDCTQEIGEKYAKEYPNVIKVIAKENGGHGSAVNCGIENASGLFLKVVDSDDWVDKDSLILILNKLKEFVENGQQVDMFLANYVYEKVGEKHKKVVSFRHAFKENEIFTWDEVRHLKKTQNILMHSIIYRTRVLYDCGMKLPEHTFYVDNLFAFMPLPYVKKIYYMNTNFYRYFIGRDDQSVNEKVMMGRIDQQIKVNKLMVDYLTDTKVPNRKTYAYMVKYLDIITTISSVFLIRDGSIEAMQKKDELWEYIKEADAHLFRRLRYGILGGTVNLPVKGEQKIVDLGYKIARKVMKFN